MRDKAEWEDSEKAVETARKMLAEAPVWKSRARFKGIVQSAAANAGSCFLKYLDLMQEPVPGLTDLDVLIDRLERFQRTQSEEAYVWVPPAVWIQLSTRVGVSLVSDEALQVDSGDSSYRVCVWLYGELDRVGFSTHSNPTTQDFFLPPSYIASVPGGTELYNSTRASGYPQHEAMLIVTDTLIVDGSPWVEEWLGPVVAEMWSKQQVTFARHIERELKAVGEIQEETVTQVGKGSRDLDHFLSNQAVVQDQLTKAVNDGQHLAYLSALPGRPDFDVDYALETVMSGYSEPNSYCTVFACPALFAHLARRGSFAGQGNIWFKTPRGQVNMVIAPWDKPDSLLFRDYRWENPEIWHYLPPADYSPDERVAYQHCREQGMSIPDAKSLARFTVSSPSRFIPVNQDRSEVRGEGKSSPQP